MRIIKRGVPLAQRTMTTKCRHCSSELEFTGADAHVITDIRDGDFLQLTCPVCFYYINVVIDAVN